MLKFIILFSSYYLSCTDSKIISQQMSNILKLYNNENEMRFHHGTLGVKQVNLYGSISKKEFYLRFESIESLEKISKFNEAFKSHFEYDEKEYLTETLIALCMDLAITFIKKNNTLSDSIKIFESDIEIIEDNIEVIVKKKDKGLFDIFFIYKKEEESHMRNMIEYMVNFFTEKKYEPDYITLESKEN